MQNFHLEGNAPLYPPSRYMPDAELVLMLWPWATDIQKSLLALWHRVIGTTHISIMTVGYKHYRKFN